MPFSAATAAGVLAIQAAIVDINGFPMGIEGTLAPGESAPYAILRFAKRFGGILPSPIWAEAIGDNNRNIHEYAFNANQMSQIGFQFHAIDMDAYAAFLAIKKFTLNGQNAVGIQTNAPVGSVQTSVIVNMDAKIADPGGSFGNKRFLNEVYSLVTVVPKLGDAQEVAAMAWDYEGRPSQAGKMPWGTAFTQATHGFTRGGGILIGTDYPLCIDTFVAETGDTTLTLTYTPDDDAHIGLYKTTAGTTTSLTFTRTDKVLTVAALAEDDIVVAKYEGVDFTQSI